MPGVPIVARTLLSRRRLCLVFVATDGTCPIETPCSGLSTKTGPATADRARPSAKSAAIRSAATWAIHSAAGASAFSSKCRLQASPSACVDRKEVSLAVRYAATAPEAFSLFVAVSSILSRRLSQNGKRLAARLYRGAKNHCSKLELLGLKMSSLLCRAYFMAVTLAFSAVCTGQTVQGATASAAQPIDPRTGVFRPAAPDLPGSGADAKAPSNTGMPISLGKDYRVGPNDLLDIEVLDLENSKRTVRVNAAGAITLPLIGAVVVAGLTAQQIEARLAEKYSEKYLQNPQVSVFIKEFTTERITIDGAVAKPGIYPLTGQITLLRALALAGGFGPIAESSEVMLFRVNEKGERQVATFDVDKIRAGKSDDPPIKGDDLIVVQRDANRRLLKDSLFRDILDSINPFSVFARP